MIPDVMPPTAPTTIGRRGKVLSLLIPDSNIRFMGAPALAVGLDETFVLHT
jgi:hypothetical protein